VTELLQAAAANSLAQYTKLTKLIPSAAKALNAASEIIGAQRTGKGERSTQLGFGPRTIFNVPITNQRSYTTMSMSLHETKALGKRIGGTINTIVMAMCSGALRRFLNVRDLLPKESLIAAVPVSLRSTDDDTMNNQVTSVRVDLATDIADIADRFKAIHASSEAAKAVVRQLKPVLGVDVPFVGSPWLVSGLATLYGRSGLVDRLPALASVLISNVPGVSEPVYLAGARMAHWYPVSIPYHGNAVNITVQSYLGLLEFGITACRRVLSQEEAHELLGYLQDALEEIKSLDSLAQQTSAPKPQQA